MSHSWCRDVERDEAVRAAEDGRPGPLPTLEEAISRAGQFAPPEAPQPPKCTERESGLRTERVTLEIKHSVPVAKWDWTNILETYRPGESVRVVEETHFNDLANVAMERDAAIRELDKLRGEITSVLDRSEFASTELTRLRNRVADLESQLESVACRAATAETALESAPAASVVPSVVSEMTDIIRSNATEDAKHAALATLVEAVCPGWRLAPAASGAAVDPVLREARLRDESRTKAYVASLDDASDAAGTEPDAWGVRRNGLVDAVAYRSFRSSAERSAEQWGGTVVPLYAAPQAAKGWLTAEEREVIKRVNEHLFETSQLEFTDIVTLDALLARSSPPEVVLPRVYCHGGDGEPLVDLEDVHAALAAAGVTVKEVGCE